MVEEKRQTEIKNLKPNSFVIIEDAPCTVEDVAISKPGKHGGAKARVSAVGIFDGKRRIIVKPADARVDVPIIEKRSAQVLAFIGDRVQIMDLEDFSITEVPKPDFELKEGEEVLVWRYGTNYLIKSKKS
jgi:translation initiation factor 5A